jgi:hypothetical protein
MDPMDLQQKPSELYSHTHYSPGDISILMETFAALSPIRYDTEKDKKEVQNPGQIYTSFKGHWESWWDKAKEKADGDYILARTFFYMYCTPFEDLPLYINDEHGLAPIVAWRLKISK